MAEPRRLNALEKRRVHRCVFCTHVGLYHPSPPNSQYGRVELPLLLRVNRDAAGSGGFEKGRYAHPTCIIDAKGLAFFLAFPVEELEHVRSRDVPPLVFKRVFETVARLRPDTL